MEGDEVQLVREGLVASLSVPTRVRPWIETHLQKHLASCISMVLQRESQSIAALSELKVGVHSPREGNICNTVENDGSCASQAVTRDDVTH